ncbi:ATP-binding protein [Massilia sp. RP-1-19]|uniref:ATP-binding protein n=1 Tax=Massilia polaris TaxID=2728846 RepID=A0A848HG57_9BURK|nr:hypothetical protein [Massilia polaris]NML60866.1 ATP-binding protein [Massilia polaris]
MITRINVADADKEQLAAFEEKVVFAESFEPRTLFGNGRSFDLTLMTAFSLHCEPVLAPQSAMRWTLQSDVRIAVLQRLSARNALLTLAGIAPTFVNGFGLWMLRLLRREEIDVETLSIAEQTKLRTAAQFLHAFLPTGVSDRLESQMEWAQTKRALRVALPTGLVGRGTLLRKLMQWVTADPSAVGSFGESRPRANVVLVTGVGGSGKSALLAELVLRHSERFDRPTVCLDFDSPSLAIPRADRLMIAFARQLAMHYPEHARPLRQFARELERFLGAGQSSSNSYRELATMTSIVRSAWEKFCAEFGLGELPTVLVLDTFEEVLIRGDAELVLVEQWIKSLVYEYGFAQLSIVVSGRTLPLDLFSQVAGSEPRTIDVGDLPSRSAAKFLRMQADDQLSVGQARGLVERHGGNPLMLRLLGRLVRDGEQHLAVDRLGRNAAQSFLYDRILKRLRTTDPIVADLAHPGLVLRRITPSIIREVLARPLGLGPLGEERSRGLFNELARQVWLVEPSSSPDVLFHRKDLRRLMLRLMYDSDRCHQLAAVHWAAVDYYSSGKALELDSESAQLEANYHLLFVRDPELEYTKAIALVRSLGADIECLPTARSARLRQQARVDLTDEELDTLGPRERELEQERHRSRMYKVAAESAVALTSSIHERIGLSGADIEYLFAQGDWRGITTHAHTFLTEHLTNSIGLEGEASSLVESNLWKVCLAFLFDTSTIDGEILPTQRLLTSEAERLGRAPFVLDRRYRISAVEAFEAAAGLFRRGGQQNFTAVWDRAETLSSIDEVRLWLLRPLAPGARQAAAAELRVHPSVFRFLSQEFEAALHDLSNPAGINDQMRTWADEIHYLVSAGPSLEVIASLMLNARPLSFAGNASAIRKLGGFMLPELYPVCRQALREVPSDVLLEFATAEAAADAFWPRDVAGPVFKTQLDIDLGRGISVLLEVSDRMGRVPALLRFGMRHTEDTRPLRRALQAWRRLERRLSPPV